MNCIDLFAGAGGLSEGFRRQGFNIVAHVEMEHAAFSYPKNKRGFLLFKK